MPVAIPTMRKHPTWTLADIPYASIEKTKIVDQTDWFYLLAGASFVETLSDLYARNLVEYFQENAAATAWLSKEWEQEEVQHGLALKAYVLQIWPDFDWDHAYKGFVQAYMPYCQTDLLGPSQALEMASRCVVETGTASFYTMIQSASPEPVLRLLAGRIRADEVHHYKYFYKFFQAYQQQEKNSRWRIGRELWKRVSEVDQEDSYLAIKNAFEVKNPGQTFSGKDFAAFRERMGDWVSRHYPFEMAIKMLLKPVSLPPTLQKMALPLLKRSARKALAS
ncbi:ferritin-like domain-containing protein [Acidithiobacillus thiooxidans]|uniref:ferritin-like domain-containing protein n=1 Tax=Acidithiobacillus TaxID=119977 RepID=UPI00026254B4|nr:ferritin-like domain-containing protein [Acidithiobacillus thiooxidans]MDR7927897.1 ferritin-like domain-containing protein [Acidithiobacillus thiooxidans]